MLYNCEIFQLEFFFWGERENGKKIVFTVYMGKLEWMGASGTNMMWSGGLNPEFKTKKKNFVFFYLWNSKSLFCSK